MEQTKVKNLAEGVEYYPEEELLLLIRCPQCGEENYAPNVVRGICTWCGFDAHTLLEDND